MLSSLVVLAWLKTVLGTASRSEDSPARRKGQCYEEGVAFLDGRHDIGYALLLHSSVPEEGFGLEGGFLGP